MSCPTSQLKQKKNTRILAWFSIVLFSLYVQSRHKRTQLEPNAFLDVLQRFFSSNMPFAFKQHCLARSGAFRPITFAYAQDMLHGRQARQRHHYREADLHRESHQKAVLGRYAHSLYYYGDGGSKDLHDGG